jgi:hypothetical protein
MLPSGTVSLIGGAPFAGKSTTMAQLIKAFTTGESFLDGLTFSTLAPTEIGMILTDRPIADNDQWLNKLGLEAIQLYSIPDDPAMIAYMKDVKDDPVYGFKVFEQCFRSLPDPASIKLLILDVFTNIFLGPSIHHAPSVHRHMVHFQQFAKRRDIAILGSCYGSKQKKGQSEQSARPVDRIIGAPTLRGCASSMMFLTAIGEDAEATKAGYQPFQWYSRHGECRTYNLKRNAEGLFVQVHGVASAGKPSRREWDVRQYIVQPMTRIEIVNAAKADGHSKSTVYEAIDFGVAVGQLTVLEDGRFCITPSVGIES